jgi:subtilisin
MAKKGSNSPEEGAPGRTPSSPIDDLLLAALERGDDNLETGRYLVSYKTDAIDEGMAALTSEGFRVADARDFSEQAVNFEETGDAEAVFFPEIGVALIGGEAFEEHGMSVFAETETDSAIAAIEPEYFVFPQIEAPPAVALEVDGVDLIGRADSPPMVSRDIGSSYLRGFVRAAETIAQDLRGVDFAEPEEEESIQVLGATWGLHACRVPPSKRSGLGIRVAVLDTGMDLGHPDFQGRQMSARSFVGQPVQDLHSHGTHCIGTAAGPLAPPGTTPRYGIAYRSHIFVGKVLSNAGSGSTASVLAGMNWAIANGCQVISMSLGSQSPVQMAYTNAGLAALIRGLLIIAASGNANSATGSPANSPTIMSVASLDPNLRRSSFSNFGKVDIAGPGRDVFASVPRPQRYGYKTGTSMATPHVAGCAALWAQSSASLRGAALWRRLQATARRLPFSSVHVGAGLVQAP